MTKAVTLAELADQNVLTALDNKVGIATTNPQSTLQVGVGITMDGNTGAITAAGGFNVGIQSAGVDVTSGVVTALNFVGTGNTFSYNSSSKTIDISIVGGGGGGDVVVDGGDYNSTSSLAGAGTSINGGDFN